MNHSNRRITGLKEMISLEQKRMELEREIESIQQRLLALRTSVINDTSAPAAAPAKGPGSSAGAGKKSSQHGAMKEKIMAALEAAGSAGVHVKELAEALGTKVGNVYSWFHSTGKRNPSIVKLSGGQYRLKQDGASSAPAAVKSTAAKGSKTRRRRRGALSTQILGALEEAGSQGLTLKEIEGKTGLKYRNIAIWFSTTGKNNERIEKLAPAHYRLNS